MDFHSQSSQSLHFHQSSFTNQPFTKATRQWPSIVGAALRGLSHRYLRCTTSSGLSFGGVPSTVVKKRSLKLYQTFQKRNICQPLARLDLWTMHRLAFSVLFTESSAECGCIQSIATAWLVFWSEEGDAQQSFSLSYLRSDISFWHPLLNSRLRPQNFQEWPTNRRFSSLLHFIDHKWKATGLKQSAKARLFFKKGILFVYNDTFIAPSICIEMHNV